MSGGYTLSTTILHCDFWKRRGSFLFLSECRGFPECFVNRQVFSIKTRVIQIR